MLKRPTPEQLMAMTRISASPDWKVVHEYLNDELSKTVEALMDAQDVTLLHIFQGRGRALRDFMDVVRTAQTTLEKLKN